MKNKIFKAGIIILVIAVVLTALCGYFIKTLAEPENIKKYLLPAVSDYLGRGISADDINIGLFSGITLKNVIIKEDANFGKVDFIKVESVVLDFSFLKLLQKELILKNVYFKSPQINIIRNAEGEFNYSDILNNIEGKKDSKKKSGASGEKKDKEGQPFVFSIEKIVTNSGDIVFIDRSTGEKEKKYRLSDLYISVKGELSDGPLKIATRAVIMPGGSDNSVFSLKINGTADLQSHSYSLNIESNDINLYSIIDAVSPEKAIDMTALKDTTADVKFSLDSSNYEQEAVLEGTVLLEVAKVSMNIPVSLKINAPFDNSMSDFNLKLNKTPILTLISLLPQSVRKDFDSVKIKEGGLSGEMSYIGGTEDFAVSKLKGRVSIDGFKADLPDYNNVPVEVTAELTFDIGKINARTTNFKIGESLMSLKIASDISEVGISNPVIDASISFNKTPILALISLLPQSVIDKINLMKVESGILSGDISYNGRIDNLSLSGFKGKVFVDGFKGILPDYGNIPVEIITEASFDKGEIDTKVNTLKIGDSELFLKAVTEIPDKSLPIKININAEASLLNADEISKAISPSEQDVSQNKKDVKNSKIEKVSKSSPDSAGKVQPIYIFFNLTSKKVKYSGLPVNNFKISGEYKNDIAVIDNISFDLGKGTVKSLGEINLKKSDGKIKGRINANDISAADLKPLLFPNFAGNIEGYITLVCDYSAKRIHNEKITKTLKGKGSISARNLILSGVEFLNKTASFLGADELRKVNFQEGSGNFTMEDEEIKYRELDLSGNELKITSNGDIAFEGKIKGTALLKMSPSFSRTLTKGKALSDFIGDKQGWISVPLEFSGTTDSPKIGLEQKAAQKQIIEKGKKVLADELEKVLGDKNTKQKPGENKRKDTKQNNSLKEGLKKLQDIFKSPGK